MKVRPVAKAVPSPIPTAAEAAADPSLLAPTVRRGPRGAGALLGAGLLGGLFAPAAALADEAVPPPEVPALDAEHAADAEAAARAEEAREAVATVVAPILQKALDEEGRGAFGCVAVDSPVVLSEADALELIRQEFAKAGVELGKGRELSGFTRTRTDWDAPRNADASEEDEWSFLSGDGDPARPQKPEAASWVFDLASEDGSLLLEYLSTIDHDELGDSPLGWWSSVSAYDFPKRAARFRTELETRTNGVPVTVGVFFDPMARAHVWDRDGKWHRRPDSALADLTEEERENLPWDKEHELLQKDARERLREQVRYFLDWARREGRIPRSRDE
jgi:hypothetical protein